MALCRARPLPRRSMPLLSLYAMKMEHEIRAPADAVVDKVLVAEGEQVASGKMLVTFVKAEETKA